MPDTTTDPLAGMTWNRWQSLTDRQRATLRNSSDLTPQLVGLEGYRVEVIDRDGQRRRFIVGRSTGWRPCHLEVRKSNSLGGSPVSGAPFQRVTRLERVRG